MICVIRVFDVVWNSILVIVLMVDVMSGDKECYLEIGMFGYVLKLID